MTLNTQDRIYFDTQANRYRRNGRFISQSEMTNIIEARVTQGFSNLDDLLLGALDTSTAYTLDDFRLAFAYELRNLHVQLAIVGGGGTSNMTPQKWGRLGRLLRDEYAYMNGFIDDIQEGNLSARQVRWRMGQYANKTIGSFWNARTQTARDGGLTEERRVLNPAEHCDDCIRLASLGWQPLGTLPDPTFGSVCRSNCRCNKEYR